MRMSETQDVMRMMVNYIDRQNKYFFNLLEVLADKGVLNTNDLIYIREHGMNEDKKNGT
jgi:hypothetical protein